MVNSMRETENCMQQLQAGCYSRVNKSKGVQPFKAIPFVEYEKQSVGIRKEQSEPSLYKKKNTTVLVRKMLDVQKCGPSVGQDSLVRPIRRIQTAHIKKRVP